MDRKKTSNHHGYLNRRSFLHAAGRLAGGANHRETAPGSEVLKIGDPGARHPLKGEADPLGVKDGGLRQERPELPRHCRLAYAEGTVNRYEHAIASVETRRR